MVSSQQQDPIRGLCDHRSTAHTDARSGEGEGGRENGGLSGEEARRPLKIKIKKKAYL